MLVARSVVAVESEPLCSVCEQSGRRLTPAVQNGSVLQIVVLLITSTSVSSQSVLIKMIHFIFSPALNNVNNVLINASNQEEFEDSLLDIKDNKNKIEVIFLYFCRFSH